MVKGTKGKCIKEGKKIRVAASGEKSCEGKTKRRRWKKGEGQ